MIQEGFTIKHFHRSGELGLRLGLLATLVMACSLGYADTPTPVPTANNPEPNPTRAVEHPTTQAISLQPTPTETAPPKGTFPEQTSSPTFLPLITLSPGDIVREMLGQVDIDRALNDLRQLTGEAPICIENECQTITNRITGRQGLRWAKGHVYEELMDLGYSVEFQDWSRSGYADQNLIARKLGMQHPEEEIYFVAHIDGVNSPAADDNGSGVVDLLELARILSGYSFSRSVVMLFSTGEEQGTLGVKSYLDQLSPIELSAIKYVVNIDMVGYDANQDRVMELWHGGHPPSIALTQTMSETIKAYQIDLSPGFVVGCG